MPVRKATGHVGAIKLYDKRMKAQRNMMKMMKYVVLGPKWLLFSEVKGQCPESQPVLAISMDVSLKESRSFAALWMPMLIRAATKGVGTIMQVPSEAGAMIPQPSRS